MTDYNLDGMRIDRNNYELFLVEYADGLLDEDTRREVNSFLLLNPDIQSQFEQFLEQIPMDSAPSLNTKRALKQIPLNQTSALSDYFQQLCFGYVEGFLSTDETNLLNQLIRADREKRQALDWFKQTKLIAPSNHFNEQLLLKKGNFNHAINCYNFESYCIAALEGWLDIVGLTALNQYLDEYPEQRIVYHQYLNTKLVANKNLVFPNKSALKKFSFINPALKKLYATVGAAAAILIFGLFIFNALKNEQTLLMVGEIVQTQAKPWDTAQTDIPSHAISAPKTTLKKSATESLKPIEKDVPPTKTPDLKIDRYHIEPVTPIMVVAIPGGLEYQEDDDKLKINHNRKKLDRIKAINNKQPEELARQNKSWQFAQAGIYKFNKLTNTQLMVEKNEQNSKTTIAFDSKLISFSTQVNRNKNN